MTCQCSQIGQYGGSETHSIPYELPPDEAKAFLQKHAANPAWTDYYVSHKPAHGIIIYDNYGEFLVWYDAQNVLHVIDITNMSIVGEIEKAPFQSDPQYLQLLQERVENVVLSSGKLGIGAGLLAIAAALVLVVTSR